MTAKPDTIEEIRDHFGGASAPQVFQRLSGNQAYLSCLWQQYRRVMLGGEIDRVTKELIGLSVAVAKSIRQDHEPIAPPACLVWGGETTVTVRGLGRGGRNTELALAASVALDGWPGVLLMALATDGTDGPTDSAGAIATGETASRARALGLDPARFLRENDSYTYFAELGDLILTGPTGTNVMDLIIALIS